MKELIINPIATTDNLPINNCKIFRCSQTWSELEPTENSKARFCQGCEKFVFLCQDPQELKFHARRLHCVAFEMELIDRDGAEEILWMGQLSDFEPEYKGPKMTLCLNPTYALEISQLEFLSRAFELGLSNYRLREILCNGRSHVLKQNIHPDLAESLSGKLDSRRIEHRLSIEPE